MMFTADKITVTRVVWFFVSQQKWMFLLAQVLALVITIDQIILPKLMSKLTKIVSSSTTYQITPDMKEQMLIVFLVWVSSEVFYRASGCIMAILMPKLQASIRRYAFDCIHDQDIGLLMKTMAGDTSNKVNELVSNISGLLYTFIRQVVPTFFSSIVTSAMFFWYHGRLGWVILVWVACNTSLSYFLMKRAALYARAHAASRNRIVGYIVDSISNHYISKLFANKAAEMFGYEKYQKMEQEAYSRKIIYFEQALIVLTLVTVMIPVVAINFYAYYYWSRQTIRSEDVVAISHIAFNVATLLFYNTTEMPNIIEKVQTISQAAGILVKKRHEKSKLPGIKITQGAIICRDLKFGYNERKLIDITALDINPGEKVGIVGPSGGGKSTLLSLILGIVKPSSGEILIDGQNISEVDPESLRRSVAVVPQNLALFNRSIIENIQYGSNDATEDMIIKAAQIAQADDFIKRLPGGYDYMVGEHGASISGGQKQRIGLARAMLKIIACKPEVKIVLMDEATSALDSILESRIAQLINSEYLKGITTVVIAHRLITVSEFDKIVVMQRGRIVQMGTHSELLAFGGVYKDMWVRQQERRKKRIVREGEKS